MYTPVSSDMNCASEKYLLLRSHISFKATDMDIHYYMKLFYFFLVQSTKEEGGS